MSLYDLRKKYTDKLSKFTEERVQMTIRAVLAYAIIELDAEIQDLESRLAALEKEKKKTDKKKNPHVLSNLKAQVYESGIYYGRIDELRGVLGKKQKEVKQ